MTFVFDGEGAMEEGMTPAEATPEATEETAGGEEVSADAE